MLATSRTSLILGGNGALGRAMVSSFKTGGWKVVSLDLTENSDANSNVLVKPDEPMKT